MTITADHIEITAVCKLGHVVRTCDDQNHRGEPYLPIETILRFC